MATKNESKGKGKGYRDPPSMEECEALVTALADAQHDGDRALARRRLISVGFSRINALTRNYAGTSSKAWPAPGRKAK